MALSAGEITAIGIGLGNIAAWSKLIYDSRKNGKDGNGKACQFHTSIVSRLATIETEKESLAKEVATLHSENRQDHSQIFSKMEALSIAVSTASEAARTAASAAATAAAAAAAARREP